MFKITFLRNNIEDEDEALKNFPCEEDRLRRLELQFESELMVIERTFEDKTMFLHTSFEHLKTDQLVAYTTVRSDLSIPEFVRMIQRECFDKGGMTGTFKCGVDTFPEPQAAETGFYL